MRALIVALALTAPATALAHTVGSDAQAAGWSLEPWIVVPLGLAAFVWAIGLSRRLSRSQGGRQGLQREALFFVLGWTTLSAAVLSPLHSAGQRSFTMHMLEHEILMMLAAPLLALARPPPTMLWGFAQPWRGAIGVLLANTSALWRRMTSPLFVTLVQAAALWLWHTPRLFDKALRSEFWHAAQHLSFLITALLFWGAMLDRRRPGGVRALCLFATSIVSGALGALMAISQSPWYEPYALLGMTPQGLTPAADQQLAGIIMWVPGSFVHAAAALALLAPLLRANEPVERTS